MIIYLPILTNSHKDDMIITKNLMSGSENNIVITKILH